MATNNKENNSLKLSIQVNLNGLSFCIIDTETRKLPFYKKISYTKPKDPVKILEEIELAYLENKELQQELNEVSVLFSNSLYSLVPYKYFEEDQASSYLKFNTKILSTDFIAHDVLKGNKIVNVYIPYTNITNFFFDKYGEFEYMHSNSVLIESIIALPKQNKPQIFVHCKNGYFDLVVMEDGDLILCNSFNYDTKEDFLYYILFTMEQLNLDPEVVQVHLLGEVNEDSLLFEIAYKYIKNINILNSEGYLNINTDAIAAQDLKEDFVLFNSLQH